MSVQEKKDFKSTIRLPQTTFPMRGNLPEKEPQILAFWEKENVYSKLLEKNIGKESFTLPDGPPYANGDIHIGHALNKVLKDIVIKYQNLSGKRAPFIPGWDCHGLPIEHKVLKELGPKAAEKTDSEIRDLCRSEAKKWVAHQKKQFQRLGVLADWENPYLTLHPSYESEEVRVLAELFDRGLVYLGNKPVYWNWFLQTALAEAEVEYHPHKSPSIFIQFPITEAATLKKLGSPTEPTFFAVWTTTPWTLPANLGVALHPDFEYGVYFTEGKNLVLAKGLAPSLEKVLGQTFELRHSFRGRDLELGHAQHPFLNQESLIVLGNHVTLDAGTGVVHTAPGHGTDDFRVGLQYGLQAYAPVDPKGLFTSEVADWAGMHIFKANPLIIERLREIGNLLHASEFTHSYPHCWRSKTPLIFRATPQWFLGLDLSDSNIRQKTLKAIDDIQFYPNWGEARFRAMIEGRPDWCISRQRLWGVPIPSLVCKKTGQLYSSPKLLKKVADLMESNGGIDAFYATPAESLADANDPVFADLKKTSKDFGVEGFTHGKDILDVWFDSGVCFAAVQKKREGLQSPADIYLEGSDQHRGWFNTSMLASMALDGHPPFRALVTHGFVMDSQGLKMSKSKGNTVDPNLVAQKSGAEIIRLWCVYEDYGQDLTCGDSEIERVTETYRKIRNTYRYLLGSLDGFNPATDKIPYEKLTEIDQWILHQLNQLTRAVTEGFETYSFYKIYHALNVFFTVDLSSLYFDILKDRMYTWKVDGLERRSSQTAFWWILQTTNGLIAPILSFLAEEVYEHTTHKEQASIFFHPFPKPTPQWDNAERSTQLTQFLVVKSAVQKELENLRAQKVIGSSLEAQVKITAEDATLQLLKSFKNLRELLVVSEVQLDKGAFHIHAQKAAGEKCVRCWTYSSHLSSDHICPKCVEALT